jgi:hypothetical protein
MSRYACVELDARGENVGIPAQRYIVRRSPMAATIFLHINLHAMVPTSLQNITILRFSPGAVLGGIDPQHQRSVLPTHL